LGEKSWVGWIGEEKREGWQKKLHEVCPWGALGQGAGGKKKGRKPHCPEKEVEGCLGTVKKGPRNKGTQNIPGKYEDRGTHYQGKWGGHLVADQNVKMPSRAKKKIRAAGTTKKCADPSKKLHDWLRLKNRRMGERGGGGG